MVRESGTSFAATLIRSCSVKLAVREARLGDGRDDALLDLGAGPADGELRQLRQVERGDIHAAADQVNLEDLDLLVSSGRSTKNTSSKRPLRIISAGSRSMRLAVAATKRPRVFPASR
jgi:hypothetical protein